MIEESVRAMLHDQDLPKLLGGEATQIVVYIQNRSPHRSLDNMTPEEAFTGRKPSVGHLQIFGCHVYIHIPKDERKKLDPTSIKGIFFGYNNSSKAYRIYIKEGQCIEGSEGVIFDKSIVFKKSKDISIDFDDEDLPIFEECTREEEDSNHEEGGPSDAKGHGATKGMLRESKNLKRYLGYATYMTKLIEAKPSTFEDAIKHQ